MYMNERSWKSRSRIEDRGRILGNKMQCKKRRTTRLSRDEKLLFPTKKVHPKEVATNSFQKVKLGQQSQEERSKMRLPVL